MGADSAIYQQLIDSLNQLRSQMRAAGQWSEQSPSQDDLSSNEPFAVDKLTFVQWLQFMFIPHMQALCETQQPLPRESAIAPMAETYFALNRVDGGNLMIILTTIDQIITDA